jgi:hypothetical protein
MTLNDMIIVVVVETSVVVDIVSMDEQNEW